MTPIPTRLAEAMLQARRVVVFSGAGMSKESGIPTFREAHTGLWARFDPYVLASADGFTSNPARVWGWYEWRRGMVERALPHAGHNAVAELAKALSARAGELRVVTQNVDDLHERAGSREVLHLHGSLFAPRCFSCGTAGSFAGTPAETPVAEVPPPVCLACGGMLRPGVVWFGETLPELAWEQATDLVRECDLLLAVGTSGVVMPAAGLPSLAKQCGALVVEINPQASELSTEVDLCWCASAAEALPRLAELLA